MTDGNTSGMKSSNDFLVPFRTDLVTRRANRDYVNILLCKVKGKSNKEVACALLPSNAGYVLSLGQEDPLEKEMATHSSILA